MQHVRILLFFAFIVALLSSCSNFESKDSLTHTQFHFRDSTTMTGRLLAASRDSVFFIDPWSKSPQAIGVHYSTLDNIVFINDASDGNIIGGAALGAVLGFFTGLAIDLSPFTHHALPSAPMNLHPNFTFPHASAFTLLGLLTGGIVGYQFSADYTVYIDDTSDLKSLVNFAQYERYSEYRMARGY